MKIEVILDGMADSKALQEHIKRRIEFGFGIHRNRIETVLVQLTRVSEPRDRKDKSCRVQAFLSSGDKVLVQIMDSDLHVAIHRAVDRASWTVARRLQRERRKANYMPFVRGNLRDHPDSVPMPYSTLASR